MSRCQFNSFCILPNGHSGKHSANPTALKIHTSSTYGVMTTPKFQTDQCGALSKELSKTCILKPNHPGYHKFTLRNNRRIHTIPRKLTSIEPNTSHCMTFHPKDSSRVCAKPIGHSGPHSYQPVIFTKDDVYTSDEWVITGSQSHTRLTSFAIRDDGRHGRRKTQLYVASPSNAVSLNEIHIRPHFDSHSSFSMRRSVLSRFVRLIEPNVKHTVAKSHLPVTAIGPWHVFGFQETAQMGNAHGELIISMSFGVVTFTFKHKKIDHAYIPIAALREFLRRTAKLKSSMSRETLLFPVPARHDAIVEGWNVSGVGSSVKAVLLMGAKTATQSRTINELSISKDRNNLNLKLHNKASYAGGTYNTTIDRKLLLEIYNRSGSLTRSAMSNGTKIYANWEVSGKGVDVFAKAQDSKGELQVCIVWIKTPFSGYFQVQRRSLSTRYVVIPLALVDDLLTRTSMCEDQ